MIEWKIVTVLWVLMGIWSMSESLFAEGCLWANIRAILWIISTWVWIAIAWWGSIE